MSLSSQNLPANLAAAHGKPVTLRQCHCKTVEGRRVPSPSCPAHPASGPLMPGPAQPAPLASELEKPYGQDPTANPSRAGTHPELERPVEAYPLGPDEAEKADSGRLHIRITSVRKRLCDPDNLSEKWMLDCLRYCKAIPGDEPDKITLETTQRKAPKGEKEETIIEIYALTTTATEDAR